MGTISHHLNSRNPAVRTSTLICNQSLKIRYNILLCKSLVNITSINSTHASRHFIIILRQQFFLYRNNGRFRTLNPDWKPVQQRVVKFKRFGDGKRPSVLRKFDERKSHFGMRVAAKANINHVPASTE